MAVRATFADPENSTVNLWLDEYSVTPGLPLDNPDVVSFVNGGGIIEAYELPAPPLTLDQIDIAALNEALTAPGTVTRALGEVVFGIIKGTIPITPSITKQQFVALLKAKMRD